MTRFARFTNQGVPLGDVQGVFAARRTRSVDGTDQLELSCFGELSKDDRIVMRDSRGYWCEWIVGSPQQSHEQGGVVTTAICDASYAELALHPLIEVQNTDYTAQNALAKALEGTRWTVGTVGVSGTKTTSAYHESSLDLIHRICEVYGCEFYPTIEVLGTSVVGRSISLVTARGASIAAHRFEYRHDLVNVTRTVGAENVVTRLYGYGKGVESIDSEGNETGGFSRKISFAEINGGKAYVEDATLLPTYGIPDGNGTLQPPCGYVEFGDCEDVHELLALTQAELDRRKQPSITYEASIASLAQAGTGWGGADIGDVVDIIDTAYPTPLRMEGRVLSIVEDLLGDWSTAELTLGNIIETATGASARMAAALATLQSNAGAWTAAASLGGNYSSDLITAINADINATGGYTYITEGQGIRTYDVAVTDPLVGAEASAVCEIKGGTMRIANTKDAQGQWEWKTVFTSGRILAELIDAIGASSGYHAQLTPTGLDVYDGSTRVAHFGAEVVLGQSSMAHTTITSTGMELYLDQLLCMRFSMASDGSHAVQILDSSGTALADLQSNQLGLGSSTQGTAVYGTAGIEIHDTSGYQMLKAFTGNVTDGQAYEFNWNTNSSEPMVAASVGYDGNQDRLDVTNGSSDTTRYSLIGFDARRRWSSDASKIDSGAFGCTTGDSSSVEVPSAWLTAQSGDVWATLSMQASGGRTRMVLNENGTSTQVYPTHGSLAQDTNIAAGGSVTRSISFGHTYAAAPTVAATLYSTSSDAGIGKLSCVVSEITTTGAKVKIFNNDSQTRAPGVRWMALG